ncbi:unnamed protein product, partial [Polarella glacialis]
RLSVAQPSQQVLPGPRVLDTPRQIRGSRVEASSVAVAPSSCASSCSSTARPPQAASDASSEASEHAAVLARLEVLLSDPDLVFSTLESCYVAQGGNAKRGGGLSQAAAVRCLCTAHTMLLPGLSSTCISEARWRILLKRAGVYTSEDFVRLEELREVQAQTMGTLRDCFAPKEHLRTMRRVPRSEPRLKDRYDCFEFRAKSALGKAICQPLQNGFPGPCSSLPASLPSSQAPPFATMTGLYRQLEIVEHDAGGAGACEAPLEQRYMRATAICLFSGFFNILQVEEVKVEVNLDTGEQGFDEAPEDEVVLALGAEQARRLALESDGTRRLSRLSGPPLSFSAHSLLGDFDLASDVTKEITARIGNGIWKAGSSVLYAGSTGQLSFSTGSAAPAPPNNNNNSNNSNNNNNNKNNNNNNNDNNNPVETAAVAPDASASAADSRGGFGHVPPEVSKAIQQVEARLLAKQDRILTALHELSKNHRGR